MHHENVPDHPSLPFSLPLLGCLFRIYYLKKTASKACQGDPAAARWLAHQYCLCPDGTTEHLLRSLLECPPTPAVGDALCQEVMENHDDLLQSLLCNYHIVPSEKKFRALYLFATGSLSEYHVLDTISGHPVLREMYSTSPEPVRELVRNAAVRYHTEAEFADALTDPCSTGQVEDLSLAEWEIIVTGLISASRHGLLYRLLLDAPVPYAVTAIRALHKNRWKPEHVALHELWNQVVATTPGRWTYPEPSGAGKRVLEKPGYRSGFLAFSPDGALLLATGYDGTTRLWDVRRGEPVETCHQSSGSCTNFSMDSRCLLTLRDGTLTARNVSNGNILFSIAGASREHCTMAVSLDSRMVAFPRAGGGFAIAALDDGDIFRTAETGTSAVTALAFSPDGESIACGLEDGAIRLISVSNANVLWESCRRNGMIEQLSFSADGSGIIAVVERTPPIFLDGKTGSCIRVFAAPPHRPIKSKISPDNRWVFFIGADETINIFRADEELPVYCITARKGGVASAAFSADHRIAVTGSINGIVRIFRFGSDTPERMFTAHKGWIRALAISPDGTVLASAGWDGVIKLWRIPEGRLLWSLDAREGTVTCLAASEAGSMLAAGTSEGHVRIWHLYGGDYVATLDAFTGSVGAIAINQGGTLIATAGSDANVRIWELPSGSLVSTLTGLKNRTYCLAFTPDGQGLLAGGWDNTIRLFRVADGKTLRSFIGHSNVITGIAVKPDGSGFASGSYDGTCRIWDLAGDHAPLCCAGNGGEVHAVAAAPDGSFVAAADREGKIRIFCTADGTCRCSLAGISPRVTGLAIMPGNDLIAASSDDGSISYFSLRQRSHLRNFSAHAGKVRGLATAGSGTIIASAGDDGTVQLLPLPVSAPLTSFTPEFIPIAARESQENPHRTEREQWNFMAAILALKYSYEICLCNPPPAVDEFEIMVIG